LPDVPEAHVAQRSEVAVGYQSSAIGLFAGGKCPAGELQGTGVTTLCELAKQSLNEAQAES
jgi:hypothetical protein